MSVLGIVLEKPNFPTTSTCPICKEATLYLFDDIVTNGVWIFCTSCKAHGDIITFGSQIWNTSLPDTLTKFSDSNVISDRDNDRVIPEYSRFVTKLKAAESFRDETQAQVWNHGDDVISCRLREFGFRYELPIFNDIVGVAHNDQIDSLCRQLGRSKPIKSREEGAAIVYPFYDLPQRLTGFLIAQYNEAYELRQNFIPIDSYKQRRPEAGYFLLDTLMRSADAQYRGTQFVSEDIHWVIKAQTKSAGKVNNFLPLVASYSGPEAESYGVSWRAFNSVPRIFHANAASSGAIGRACNAKGYVSVIRPKQATDEANLTSIRVRTQTWQENLKETLLGLNEINAAAFAEQLYLPHDKLHAFLTALPHPFSAGFAERVMAEVTAAPAGPQQKWLVLEKENGWWNHIGRQISNVCPVITKIIQTDHGEKIYTGVITADKGETYTFTDSADRIESMGLLAYCDAVLAAHKKLVVYDRLWNARSHLFALQLHPPELVYVPTTYGWDTHNQVFRFDKYEITNSGEVRNTPTWPRKGSTISFDDPTPVAPLPIRDFVNPSHANSYVWNITAAVIGNLIAPILNIDPTATAVTRRDFNTVAGVTAALCCPVERAVAAHKQAARGFLTRFETEPAWPTLVFNTFGDEIISNAVPRHFNQKLIVRLSQQACAVAPGYGWQTLLCDTPATKTDFQVLRHVVPAYIQYVLAGHMRMFKPQQPLYRQVLTNLHEWLLATYGETFNLMHAAANFRDVSSAHTALFDELSFAFSTGKIAVLPQPRKREQARNYVLQKKDHWWLNRHAVDRYFYVARSAPPNWTVIADLLQQNSIYLGEQTVQNMSGFLVNKDWCRQFWSEGSSAINNETG